MTTIILKVQLKDEIRRVSLNLPSTSMNLTELEERVLSMFPQLQDFVMMIRSPATDEFQHVFTNAQLSDLLRQVQSTRPPILRIRIIEGEKPQVTEHVAEFVKAPAIVLQHAQLHVRAAEDEVEEEEEGDDEEEIEEVEDALINRQQQSVEEEAEQEEVEEEEDEEEEEEEGPDSVCESCGSYVGEDSCFEKARYKCLNCLNVVLCEYCERQEVHDPSHLLVKLNVNVQNLPLKQQIVFVSHIEDPVQRAESHLKRKELRQALKLERKEKRKQERLEKKRVRKLARALKKQEELASAMQESLQVPEEQQPQPEVLGVPEEIPPLELAVPAVPEEEPLLPSEEEEIEDAVETVREEDWSVSSLLDGFQIVAPRTESREVVEEEKEERAVDSNTLQIRGFALGEKLAALEKMGFGDRNKNIFLLVKNLMSLEATVDDLVRA